jgi:hypothetical protein
VGAEIRSSARGSVPVSRRWTEVYRVRSLLSMALLLSLAAATAAGDRAPARSSPPAAPLAPHPGRATLPRFALFGWVSPPADSTTAGNYAELAGAGLNLTVLAWEDPGLVAPNLARLEVSAPVGVKNLLLDNRLDHVRENDPASHATLDSITAAYRDHPAFLGYYLGDEPPADRFPRIAEWFRLLRSRDPLHPGWNNLFGRGAFPNGEAFLTYLRDYVTQVQPAVLSTDHYDHFVNGERGQFIENVAGTAQVAREAGIPFWGIVLLTQHGTYRPMDDGLLAWQVAQWLSYGARGIGYFTYWSVAPEYEPEHAWKDGMVRWDGTRSPHYDRVRALNEVVKPVGEALAGLTWLGTEHAGGVPVGGTAFAPDELVAAVEGRATLGTFVAHGGRPHLFVANRDSSAGRTITLELVGERTVERLDVSGAWSPWPSAETASGRHVELPLPPGGFALLRLSGGGCAGIPLEHCRGTLTSSPEPAQGSVRFAAQRVLGPSTITLLDAGGRRIWSRTLTGEAPVVMWDGHDEKGARAKPGIYWARLEDGKGAVTRRITWLGRP